MEEYVMESVVRRYHIYKSIWHPVLGEQPTLELLLLAIALSCLLQRRFNENMLLCHLDRRMNFDTSIITRTDVHVIHTFVWHMRFIDVGENHLKTMC